MASLFDVAAILITVAAISGYVNHRVLRLPATTGTLLATLVGSLLLVLGEWIVPGAFPRDAVEQFLAQIDFSQTLMRGLLCFLLFAGALHVDLDGLLSQ